MPEESEYSLASKASSMQVSHSVVSTAVISERRKAALKASGTTWENRS